MKNLLCLCAAGMMLASCGGEKSEHEKYYDKDYKPEANTAPSAPVEKQTEPEAELTAGEKLIAASDCRSCHQNEIRVVGPAYKDVADKYEDTAKNIDYLAGKIIQGGSGIWGEIPMNPHPNISEDDAKEMARYVLSLNDSQ